LESRLKTKESIKHFHALFFVALVVAGAHGEKTVFRTLPDIYKKHARRI